MHGWFRRYSAQYFCTQGQLAKGDREKKIRETKPKPRPSIT
jgi:hypothetical protein